MKRIGDASFRELPWQLVRSKLVVVVVLLLKHGNIREDSGPQQNQLIVRRGIFWKHDMIGVLLRATLMLPSCPEIVNLCL